MYNRQWNLFNEYCTHPSVPYSLNQIPHYNMTTLKFPVVHQTQPAQPQLWGKVALKALSNNQYVGVKSDGTLVVGAGAVKGSDVFELWWDSQTGEVSYKASNGNFVSFEPTGKVDATRDQVGSWERTQLIVLFNGPVVIKALSNGRFVSFQPDGQVVADRISAGTWERVLLEKK